MLRVLDAVAHRYGKWPHEVLALPCEELTLVLHCCDTADADACRRIAQIASGGGIVFPTVNLGG